MIFFIADQIAGAEYVLPFLKGQKEAACPINYKLFASRISGDLFARHGFDCEVVLDCNQPRIEAAFEKDKPSACFMSATGNSLIERTFLLSCRSRHIYSVQCIDNWVNYRHRFTQGGVELFPDRILTLDPRAAEAMIAEGIPADIIKIVGQPYFEYKRSTERVKGFGERLLIITQPVSKFYRRDLGYDELDFVTGAVRAATRAGIQAEKIDVNLHPSELPGFYRDHLARSLGKAGEALNVSQSADLALTAYATVIGMFSSLLAQAALSSVSVGSFQPNAIGSDHCFLSASGFIPRFTTEAELEAFLKSPQVCYGSSELIAAIDGSCARFERMVLERCR